MKQWYFVFIIIIFGLIQPTLLEGVRLFNIKPDLLLITVVISSLSLEIKFAVSFSILAGFLKDTLGINSFGINILLFPLWSLFIIKISKKISFDSNLVRILCIFAVTFLNDLSCRLILLFLGYPIGVGIFLRVAFFGSFYTAAVLPLVFKITKPLFYRD